MDEAINRPYRAFFVLAHRLTLVMLAMIPLQIVVFVAAPPPATVEGFFALFQRQPFLGLLSLDLLYLINNAILIVIYLALFLLLAYPAAARPMTRLHAPSDQPNLPSDYLHAAPEHPHAPSAQLHAPSPAALLALVFSLVGIACYYPSNPAFEMLTLSRAWAAAPADGRPLLLAAGEAVMAGYTGTAFDAYYVMNSISLILFAVALLRDGRFPKPLGAWGLASGILMIVPSSAGLLGMVFSLLSLIPWMVFISLLLGSFRSAADTGHGNGDQGKHSTKSIGTGQDSSVDKP